MIRLILVIYKRLRAPENDNLGHVLASKNLGRFDCKTLKISRLVRCRRKAQSFALNPLPLLLVTLFSSTKKVCVQGGDCTFGWFSAMC